jgi:transposase-like protein
MKTPGLWWLEQKLLMIKKSPRYTQHTYSNAFKARIALAALCKDKTMMQLCAQFELHL